MKIQRTIPPAATPISINGLLHGFIGVFYGRPYLKRFEEDLKKYFGIRHVFLTSSGKAALTLILQALRALRPERDKVLIPAYTCFSVPSAIVKAKLKISLCDINPETFDFDYRIFAEALTENTLCVIPTHLFGIPADIERINRICKEKGIYVVEDAAQAMGVKLNGKFLGTIGDVGFFSLGRGKNIACGSGGIVITNSDLIADSIKGHYANLEYSSFIEDLKDFLKFVLMAIFIRPSLYWLPAGMPFLKLGQTMFYKDFPIKKFTGMKAGLLKGWQKQLEESNRIRKENSEYFFSALNSTSIFQNGFSTNFLRLPFITESREIKERMYSFSKKLGLGISTMYPTPINEILEIRTQFNGKAYPSANKIAKTLLTLPTHPYLSNKDREKIIRHLTAIEI